MLTDWSVQFSRSVMSNSLWPQHAWLSCPSRTPGACSNSRCLSSRWCHPTISSSVVPSEDIRIWLIFVQWLCILWPYILILAAFSFVDSLRFSMYMIWLQISFSLFSLYNFSFPSHITQLRQHLAQCWAECESRQTFLFMSLSREHLDCHHWA